MVWLGSGSRLRRGEVDVPDPETTRRELTFESWTCWGFYPEHRVNKSKKEVFVYANTLGEGERVEGSTFGTGTGKSCFLNFLGRKESDRRTTVVDVVHAKLWWV